MREYEKHTYILNEGAPEGSLQLMHADFHVTGPTLIESAVKCLEQRGTLQGKRLRSRSRPRAALVVVFFLFVTLEFLRSENTGCRGFL